MTEDEAKTKWCPFARAQSMNVAVSRDGFGAAYDTCLCIGSACMAWRWKMEPLVDGFSPRIESKTDGRCGLAGKP
jgi:hypothetical protein